MKSSKGSQNGIKKIGKVGRILFWENKITASLIYSSLFVNALICLGLFLLTRGDTSILVGHYNVFFGIDILIDLADKNNLWKLFLPPMGGLFFLGLSIIMSIFFILQLDLGAAEEEIKNSFVSNKALSFMGSRLLLIGAWLVQLILVVYLISAWFINR
jgi:hypothetical protein